MTDMNAKETVRAILDSLSGNDTVDFVVKLITNINFWKNEERRIHEANEVQAKALREHVTKLMKTNRELTDKLQREHGELMHFSRLHAVLADDFRNLQHDYDLLREAYLQRTGEEPSPPTQNQRLSELTEAQALNRALINGTLQMGQHGLPINPTINSENRESSEESHD